MSVTSKSIHVKNIPHAVPQVEDFETISEEINIEDENLLKENELLIELQYVSVDPYLRGRLQTFHNNVVQTLGIAKVISSKNKNFNKDDTVTGVFPWKQYSVTDGKTIQPATKDLIAGNKHIDKTLWLSTLGMTGMTAYQGLFEVGKCEEKENVLVSGAAGAVGMVVGQLAKKVKNCHVVGIAGTNEKCQHLIKDLSFDSALNYKDYNNNSKLLQADLKKAFPNGIDLYFDNTGGFITESVWDLLNKNARVLICGQIANYNHINNIPKIDDFLFKLIYKHIRVEGFIVYDFKNHEEFYKNMLKWVNEKLLVSKETIVEGFDNIPKAFIGLFSGENTGKMVVDCRIKK